ncbi:hypothetical protein DL770_010095 [Monosporascus sp. CRB-9-2]|nr:hypothetical protein DL770_010095 [Monosporascus sp. CRB-9-2]
MDNRWNWANARQLNVGFTLVNLNDDDDFEDSGPDDDHPRASSPTPFHPEEDDEFYIQDPHTLRIYALHQERLARAPEDVRQF